MSIVDPERGRWWSDHPSRHDESLFYVHKIFNKNFTRKFAKRNDFFAKFWVRGRALVIILTIRVKQHSQGNLVPARSHAAAILFVCPVVNMPHRECQLREEKQAATCSLH